MTRLCSIAAIPQNYNERQGPDGGSQGTDRDSLGIEQHLIEISIRVGNCMSCDLVWQWRWFFFLAPFKLRTRASISCVDIGLRTFLWLLMKLRDSLAAVLVSNFSISLAMVLLLLSLYCCCCCCSCVLRLMIKMHLQFQYNVQKESAAFQHDRNGIVSTRFFLVCLCFSFLLLLSVDIRTLFRAPFAGLLAR